MLLQRDEQCKPPQWEAARFLGFELGRFFVFRLVDRPRTDSEFTTPRNQGEQNRMDLLSVVMHEVGHMLGFEHSETGVMAETLAPGSRPIQASDLASYDLVFADLARLLSNEEQHRRSS